MLVAVIILCFISTLLIILAFSSLFVGEKAIISSRLSRIGKIKTLEAHDELNLPLYTRVIKPIVDEVNKSIAKIMPSEIKAKIEKKLQQAGNPLGFTVNSWINFQIGLLFGLPLFTIAVAMIGGAELKKIFIVLALEIVMGVVFPKFVLSRKIIERQDEIIRTLPDILDLLTVSVEAGLGFDAALSKVVDKVPGELSNEFTKVIQEIKVGTPKREALRNMAKRVNVPDLTTFIGSVIQADQLGVSIGNVLRIQSGQMRQKRRQRAQEKAMKAPVKMLFPMVFFIFPTIFAVLLGPVAIRLIENFKK